MTTSVLKHLRDGMLNPGSWNALWKLDLCLFLVPITSPGKISYVSAFSHGKVFPFRVCISLAPLRTEQKDFPETQQYFPLGSCHIPFPWTKLCGFHVFGRKPTCPSRVCDFRRIIARSYFNLKWMNAGREQHKQHRVVSNFWWKKNCRGKQSEVTSACIKRRKEKTFTFFAPSPEKMRMIT